MIKLIVGLGNPGSEYERTRHNIGFRAIDFFAEAAKLGMASEKFGGLVHKQGELLLGKPLTFMNRSGTFVAACAHFYQIAPENILVIHDEMDLALGAIKVKPSGGHNGHRGVENIMQTLGTERFSRLKIGIGRSKIGLDPASYVLGKFSSEEEILITGLWTHVLKVLQLFVTDGFEIAATYANSISK